MCYKKPAKYQFPIELQELTKGLPTDESNGYEEKYYRLSPYVGSIRDKLEEKGLNKIESMGELGIYPDGSGITEEKVIVINRKILVKKLMELMHEVRNAKVKTETLLAEILRISDEQEEVETRYSRHKKFLRERKRIRGI